MAKSLSFEHKCCGVILMGDMNARHVLWNDTQINNYGKIIESKIDWTEFGIHSPQSPTFLADNGNSLIDLVITSTKVDPFIRNIGVDYDANLYTGAPTRGHVPILFHLEHSWRYLDPM